MPTLFYGGEIRKATVREGHKGVLLVVDVQVGVMSESWDAPRIIPRVRLTRNVLTAAQTRSTIALTSN